MPKRTTDIYDAIIIGGGPAGLSAGIYTSRAKLKTVLLEKLVPGGQLLLTAQIENYPGFEKEIQGLELTQWMTNQAKNLGLNIVNDEVVSIKHVHKDGHKFILKTISGKELKSLSVIVTSGAHWKKLGVPGEEELIGRGVSYCGTCDGPLVKAKDVIVVGGGDKAVEEALFLTKFANKVTLVHRRDRLRAVEGLQERLFANPKIEVVWDSTVTGILGEKCVSGVKVDNKKTGKATEIKCGAVFIFIGIAPNSAFLKGAVDLDEKGFVITDSDMRTSLDGIFAAGDLRKKSLYQIATAVGEAATAAFSAQKYVEELKGIAYK